MFRKPCKGIGDSFGLGGQDINPVASVVIHGGAEVVAIDGVGCPGFANGWFFVDKDSGARWSKGCFVIVESTMNLGPCG